MELINIQLPQQSVADLNDYYPFDNEPARKEAVTALNSVAAPYQVKKAKPFRDDEDEAVTIEAEFAVTSEGAIQEQASNELQSYEHLDEVLTGLQAPEIVAASEESETGDRQDAADEVGNAENALNSVNADTPMALSPEEMALTDSASALINIHRKNRYQLGEIFDLMHESLAKRGGGIWQAWCRLIHFPVKTADAYRNAYHALKAVPKELLTALLEAGVDPAKPKATKALLEIVDTCYGGYITDKLVCDLVSVVKETNKREPSKKVRSKTTVSVPVVPLGTLHIPGACGAKVDGAGDTTPDKSLQNAGTTLPPTSLGPVLPVQEPVQTIKLLLTESDRKQFDALENNLRPFLGTTCKEETVLEALRQLAGLNANIQSASHSDEEVLVCV